MEKFLKRSLSILLAFAIIFSSVYAGLGELDFSGLFLVKAEAVSSGKYGNNLTWTLDDNGTLTISGTGNMDDMASPLGSYWGSLASDIKSVVIKSGVTSIGVSAFMGCSNILYVSIPDTVTTIKTGAFADCASLTSVTIPKSITQIDDGVFSGCINLSAINVNINNLNYKSVDGVLFNKSGTELISYPVGSTRTYYQMPNDVTIIRYRAFDSCNALISVKLSDSVKTVEEYAFSNCVNLKSIFLPNSLEEVLKDAFEDCGSLKTIFFSGTEVQYKKLKSKGSVFNPSGLKKLTATVYCDCSANILDHVLNVNSTTLPDTKMKLSIINIDDQSNFKGDTLSLNGKNISIDGKSISISLDSFNDDNTVVIKNTASEFYETRIKKDFLDNFEETIFFERRKSDTKPYINYLYCKSNETGSKWKNAFFEDIAVTSTSTESFNIEMSATAQSGSISKYYLAQGGVKPIESKTGSFSNKVIANSFKPGKPIVAYCVDSNGRTSRAYSTQIKVETSAEDIVSCFNGSSIELFSTSGTSFTISDKVPIVGGTEIGLDFARLPISVSVEGSKYKVAVGLDKKTFTKDEWNLYKKALKEIKDMGLKTPSSDSEIANDRQRYKKMQELRKAYGGKVVKGKVVGDGGVDWNILGYVEWEVVKGSPVITDSYVGISANASYSWQAPYVVLAVPCYTELGVSVTASIGGSASIIVADKDLPIEWDIKLSIEPSLSLGAGLGCPAFLSLGVEGSGKFKWYQEFLNKYRKIDLTLSASVKAKVFLAKFEKEFATKTWNLWSGTYGSKSTKNTSGYINEFYSSSPLDFFDSDNYNTLADRDYVEATEWIGGYTPALFRSRAINVSGYENTLLQTSIYDDSRQQLVEFDGGKMLVWVMDDITRDSANRTELVYSLYDENTSTWSEPVAVSDDGTADFLPDVVSEGENVWVTWQNLNTTLTEENATIENYSAAAEIYVAKYNGLTGEFETAIQVTDDALVDSMPVITAENGSVSVAWISNADNDYFGVTGVNNIKSATISNGILGETQTIKTDLTSISAIDCKLSEGEFYIAYSYDMDNDYNDMSDTEIFQLKVVGDNITESRLTENIALDSAPSYTELGGKDVLVWYSESNFNVLSLSSNEVSTVFDEPVGATDIYSVSQSAGDITYIIWSQSVGEQVAFYGAVYDGSEWGEPVLLGEASGKALNPSAIVDADGTMFVVYNSVVQEQVTDIIEETGEEFTYYTDVQTDLALLKVFQNSNISVSDEMLDIKAESVFPGEIIPLTVTVKNNGTTVVDDVNIYVDGQLSSTVAVDLLPGKLTEVIVNYTVPETVSETTLKIYAEPTNSADYDSSDNEVSVTYGYTELDVSDVLLSSTALNSTVTTRICNVSAVDSGAFTVEIRENSQEGLLVSTQTCENLAPGEAFFVSQEIRKSLMEFDEEGVQKYYIEVISDSTEYLTGNNSSFAVFTQEDNSGISHELLEETVTENAVNAYGIIKNKEFAAHDVYAKIEALDENGQVIGFKMKKVSLSEKETYTIDETVQFNGEYYETRITLQDVEDEGMTLRIPEALKSVGEGALDNCPDIVKVIIPETVTCISANAFIDSYNLTVYCFPDSAAHTYCEENSIPYVLYKFNPIGKTEIDKNNKFIFTSNYMNKSIDDIVTITGYTFEITSVTDLHLFGTGTTLSMFDDKDSIGDYTVIVNGDLNGDSVCDIFDATVAQLYSVGLDEPDENEILAANGCISDELDANSYQNVVNMCLAS